MRLKIYVAEGDSPGLQSRPGHDAYASLFDNDGASVTRDGDGLTRWHTADRHASKKMIEVSVPGTSTVDQLTQRCLAEARSAKLACWPTEPLAVWLLDAVTGERLEAEQRVTDLDLAEGDVLVLCIEHPPQALYSLAPIPDSAALIRRLQLAEGVLPPDGGPRLWGVLLYTDADAELASYVRTHFEDLNALSGPATRVFVIERPADWRTAKRYWRKHLEPELYRVLSTMRWLAWQPFDHQGAYEIADLMGVDRDLLPCLVFFHPTGRPPAEVEKIVFRIEDVSVGYFRALFGGIAGALRAAGDGASPSLREQLRAEEAAAHSRFEAWFAELQQRDPEWWRGPLPTMPEPTLEETLHTLAAGGPAADAEAFARVRSASEAIRSRLRPAQQPAHPDHIHTFHNCRVVVTSGATVSENFYFQGENTTFINRPQDTVIRDFQNTYGTGAGAEDLIRLLELVLSSRNLTDSERNEAAGAVHDVARLSAEPEADVPAVRTRLQRLRELLSSSADIAQPALAIIASVAALFAG